MTAKDLSRVEAGDAAPPADPRRSDSYRQLLRALSLVQKPVKGAPAYSRFVNRRLGRALAAIAFKFGLTPNLVTAVSAALSSASIALLALVGPSPGVGVLVGFGLVLGYAFDAADGQLARLRGGGSRSGEWLDHMVDSGKISCLHLAVLISWYRVLGLSHAAWLLIPIGFTAVANVMFFGMILNDQLRRGAGATVRPARRGTASVIRSALVIPTDYGVLCVSFLLLGWNDLFRGVYTCLFAANAAFLFLAVIKWFRDMAELD